MAETLQTQFSDGQKRSRIVDDAVSVIEAEIQDKGGLAGLAVKGAFALVKGTSPGFVRQVVAKLFDEFLSAFEGPYSQAVAEGRSPGALIVPEKSKVASDLLRATDERVRRMDNKALRKAYEKLRPTAQKHVEDAAPRLAGLLDRHASPN